MRSSLMRTDEVPPVNWETAKHGARRSGKTVKSQRRISEKLKKFMSYKNKKQKNKLKFFLKSGKEKGENSQNQKAHNEQTEKSSSTKNS